MTPEIQRLFVAERAALLDAWLERQRLRGVARPDLIDEAQRREESDEVLRLLGEALTASPSPFPDGTGWDELKGHLERLGESRAAEGFSPGETTRLMLTLKEVVFERLRDGEGGLSRERWQDLVDASTLLDSLALYSTEALQRSREAIIERQQQDVLELSTPVVELWDGILGLPLIGTLDSRRTRQVMETLLQRIADTESSVAIIDISGVPTVDTLTAQYLTRTAAAVRLMGADCIVSGIRPQIARTIAELGIALDDLPTRTTLAAALALAFERTGRAVAPRG